MNFNCFFLNNVSKCYQIYRVHYVLRLRNFNTSAELHGKQFKAAMKLGKTFNKFIGQNSKRKNYYVDTFITATPIISGAPICKFKGSKENTRRITVLNKLFMMHISELMASGKAADILLGLNIEISNVAMASTFSQLNVYWMDKGTENDQLVESRLFDVSISLRHELSQLRVMGEVPRIVFVRDKEIARQNRVEDLLKRADFGEDYLPVDMADRFRNDDTNMYNADGVKLNDIEEELPEMSHNTFNLRHDFILKKIQRGVEKSKAFHRFSSSPTQEADSGLNKEVHLDSLTPLQRKESLDKFLLQRKIQRAKSVKAQRRFVPQINLNNDNIESVFLEEYMRELDEKYNEKDYLDDKNDVK
uniref:Ribosome-binding factor A, mitochondrial n=1 Tax=Clastoptera arizonana TaxID=38151 RepID=A0A1B6C1M9_9HEMI